MSFFDEYNEEFLLERVLEVAPEGIDTREGSIFYDAVIATINVLAELYVNADMIAEQSSIVTATGDYLDMLANQLYVGHISREQSVKALYEVEFAIDEGVGLDVLDIEDGDLYIVGDLYFRLVTETDDNDEIVKYYLEAENGGTEYNGYESTEGLPILARPVESVEYLSSATVKTLVRSGVDLESDDDFRARIQTLLSAPSENANMAQYKTWCENIDGVGSATIIPLFAGPNTIKAVLVDNEYKPCPQEVVDAVQKYIDPITQNTKVIVDGQEIVVGDGFGNGMAPLGAHFYASAATAYDVGIIISAFTVVSGYDETTVKSNVKKNIENYLSSLVRNSTGNSPIVIVQSKMVSCVYAVEGIDTIGTIGFRMGGSIRPTNITVPLGQIPVLKEVTFDESND